MFYLLFALSLSAFPPRVPQKPKIKNLNSIQCDICQAAVVYVKDCLQDEKVEEEIIADIDMLCQQYPSPYDQLCTNAVKNYVPTIIYYVEQGLETIDLCVILEYCDATTAKIQKAKRAPRTTLKRTDDGNVTICDLCTITVNYIDSLMTNETVEEIIIEKVQNFCDTLSFFYSIACDMIASSYVPTIMEMIDQKIKTLDICYSIHMCNEAQYVSLQNSPVARLPRRYVSKGNRK